MKTQSHEIVLLSFRAGVPVQRQRERMAAADKVLRTLTGFVERRYYFNATTGRWVDHVTWTDGASAKAAMEAAMGAPEVAALMQDIEEKSMVFDHYERVA